MQITQRTRLETFQGCPRRGYYAYLHNGRGISRRGYDPDLLMGTAVHVGIEHLLKMESEDEAAAAAVIAFSKVINDIGVAPIVIETEAGFEQQPVTSAQETFMVNMVEALVRAFARVRLPRLLANFTILDIEREEGYQLTDNLVFLSRSDFITERKADGELFIHNLKTVKWPDGNWRKKFPYDQQTLSELLGPETRLGRKFGGVIIEGLVKGLKNVEYPKGSGVKYNNSPLLWCWSGPDSSPFPTDIRIKYEWTDDTGKQRRLGPSYNRVPVYTVMPIRDWIDKIAKEEPALLEAQLVTLPPVIRSEREIASWKTSTVYAEGGYDVSYRLAQANGFSENVMDIAFPKFTANGNCLGYGQSTCPFFGICWEKASPDDQELYMPRPYNHPDEDPKVEWPEKI